MRGIVDLLRQTVADDFRAAADEVLTDQPILRDPDSVVTISITEDSFSQSLSLSDQRRRSDAPEIVWFNLNYTVRNAEGVQKSGVIAVFGPEPGRFDTLEVQQRAVVKTAASRLREAIFR